MRRKLWRRIGISRVTEESSALCGDDEEEHSDKLDNVGEVLVPNAIDVAIDVNKEGGDDKEPKVEHVPNVENVIDVADDVNKEGGDEEELKVEGVTKQGRR